MTHLFLFTIGPVQSFIAAARRTQDLYVGSRMLSMIASAGVSAAIQNGADMLFPVMDANHHLPLSVSHRFAFLSEHEPGELAKHIEAAMRSQWQDGFATPVRDWLTVQIGSSDWHDTFDKQTANWLECYWVAVPYVGEHKDCYGAAGKALAARKQARFFPQVKEEGQKCTLTGELSALKLDWKRLQEAAGGDKVLRDNEKLGAIALVKRFAQQAGCDLGVPDKKILHFPSTDYIADVPEEDERSNGKEHEGYIAILHMDGDSMGGFLSKLTSIEQMQKVSWALTLFAEGQVPHILERFERATLVYAGGDDVLALVPLPSALACANAIRTAFFEDKLLNEVADELNEPHLTMSAGIAITPYNLPLDTGLQEARHADEVSAKDDYGRNAVAVHELHGSGQIRESGAKWVMGNGDSLMELITDFEWCFYDNLLSGKYAYDLMQISQSMGGEVPAEARAAEAKRLLKRRTAEGKSVPAELATRLAAFGEDLGLGETANNRWESLANWLILARFLAKGGKR